MFRNLRSSYIQYKKEIENPVSQKDYINITNGFMKKLMSKVLDGEEVKLPEKMGAISIIGNKITPKVDEKTGEIKGAAPDWVKTKKLWDECPECKEKKQLVYHLNEHSSGIRYRFIWSKYKVILENKSLYSIRFTRTNKREVMRRVKEGKEYRVKVKRQRNG